jgi:alpha-tubulin suppressor-like RCC1 family protein
LVNQHCFLGKIRRGERGAIQIGETCTDSPAVFDPKPPIRYTDLSMHASLRHAVCFIALLTAACASSTPDTDTGLREQPDLDRPSDDTGEPEGDMGADVGPADMAPGDASTGDMQEAEDMRTVDLGPCPQGCDEGEVCLETGCFDPCVDIGAECGVVEAPDGTEIECGSCEQSEACQQNTCIDPCSTIAAECGTVRWADVTVDCGACATGTCYANQCAAPGYRGIDGGFGHTCGLKSNGQLHCWGENDEGELGNGLPDDSTTPVQVTSLFGMKSFSTYNQHACSSKAGGVWCWGVNALGQLGDGTTDPSASPVQVPGFDGILEVTVGGAHSCGLLEDGTVHCWGANGQGQLGIGTLGGSRTDPTQVVNITEVVSISAGSAHTCAMRADGSVFCWGWNEKGQLGDNMSATSRPVRVEGIAPALSLAAGRDHTCVVTQDLEVWCWGDGSSGQLGRGSTASSNVPVEATLADAVSVIAGAEHTCAIDSDRRIWCWGANDSAQLGINSQTQMPTPTMVSTITNVLAAGAGFDHTCATRDDGTAWCWGSNASGQLGNGTNDDALVPVRVSD